MTLCVAWIREKPLQEELVIATDSALTCGEKWNQGIKLFELPRTDCVICFAGNTGRAYPLILNLISSIKLDKRIRNSNSDIREVLDYISELFSSLVLTIDNEGVQEIHELRGDAKFLFGGWSWEENRFRLWKLFYSEDVEGFIYKELTDDLSRRKWVISYLGNPEEIEVEADKIFKKYIADEDKIGDALDMEPLRVLVEISRNSSIREVDGAVQIAKVYKSGVSEFFGVFWPSIEGAPHFQGRDFYLHDKPDVRYIDPDTLEIIEDAIPVKIRDMSCLESHKDFPFIQECYTSEGELKPDLSESQKEKLLVVLKERAYLEFVEKMNSVENGQDE